jgi:transketolase
VVRPADANETVHAWAEIQRRFRLPGTPTALALSRQALPVLPDTSAEGVARGGYVLADSDGPPGVIVLASGSETQLALSAKERLHGVVSVRVVSMPCQEWFAAQSRSYRDQVLPPEVTARVSVEAGIGMSWRHLVGDRGIHLGVESYGASADMGRLFAEHGLTVDDLVAAIHELVDGPADHVTREERPR